MGKCSIVGNYSLSYRTETSHKCFSAANCWGASTFLEWPSIEWRRKECLYKIALLCISSDILATRKHCGFMAYNALKGILFRYIGRYTFFDFFFTWNQKNFTVKNIWTLVQLMRVSSKHLLQSNRWKFLVLN